MLSDEPSESERSAMSEAKAKHATLECPECGKLCNPKSENKDGGQATVA